MNEPLSPSIISAARAVARDRAQRIEHLAIPEAIETWVERTWRDEVPVVQIATKHLAERIETLERLDREAATHVEAVIAMRTRFTGMPPYVGWKGLGLALKEALDERDMLLAATNQSKVE